MAVTKADVDIMALAVDALPGQNLKAQESYIRAQGFDVDAQLQGWIINFKVALRLGDNERAAAAKTEIDRLKATTKALGDELAAVLQKQKPEGGGKDGEAANAATPEKEVGG